MIVEKLLQEIESLFDGEARAYVAGGYLRDTEHSIKPKDVDVMIVPSETVSDDPWWIADVLTGLPGYNVTKTLIEECYYMSDMSDRGVIALVMGEREGTPLQFIVYGKTLTQEQLVDDMDINICQIAMNSDGKIHSSAAYAEGFETKTILMMHDYSVKRQVSRLRRMLEKYPDFDAPQLAEMECAE